MTRKPDLTRAILYTVSGGVLTAVVGVLGAAEAHAEPKNTAGQPSPPPASAGSEKAAERRRETAEKKEAEATKEGAKKPSGSANAAERRRENAEKKEKTGRGEQRERHARQNRWANASQENKKQAEPARQRKEKTSRPSRSTTSAKHEDMGGRGNGKLHLRLASDSSRDPDGDPELCTLGGGNCEEVELSGGPDYNELPEPEEMPLKMTTGGGGGLPFFGGGGKGSAAPPPGGGKGQSGGGPTAGQPDPEKPAGGKGTTVRPAPAAEPPTLPRGTGSSAGRERTGGPAPSRPAADRAAGKGSGKPADRTEGRSGRKSSDRSGSNRKPVDRAQSNRKPDDRAQSNRKPDDRPQDKSSRKTTERPQSRNSTGRAESNSGRKPVERATGRSGDQRGERDLVAILAAKRARYEKQEKEFLEQGKDIFGNTIPARASARNLAQDIRHHSRYEPFTPDGRLTAVAVKEASRLQEGGVIGNPYLKEVFARSGGISQWAKYSTRTHHSPYGDFQVHFYFNRTTGQVYYDQDYKVVMNRRITD